MVQGVILGWTNRGVSCQEQTMQQPRCHQVTYIHNDESWWLMYTTFRLKIVHNQTNIEILGRAQQIENQLGMIKDHCIEYMVHSWYIDTLYSALARFEDDFLYQWSGNDSEDGSSGEYGLCSVRVLAFVECGGSSISDSSCSTGYCTSDSLGSCSNSTYYWLASLVELLVHEWQIRSQVGFDDEKRDRITRIHGYMILLSISVYIYISISRFPALWDPTYSFCVLRSGSYGFTGVVQYLSLLSCDHSDQCCECEEWELHFYVKKKFLFCSG